VRAWDQFIGVEWNFHEFVIHYAPVPKRDLIFFSKYDDGIFVMKYLELWDPCINMIQKFTSSHIPDIRVQYMNSMVFSHHNCNNDAKEMVSNHKAMVSSFNFYVIFYHNSQFYFMKSIFLTHVAGAETEIWIPAC